MSNPPTNYQENHCWQYEIRLKNFDEDVKASGLSRLKLDDLSCSDFTFQHEKKDTIFAEVKQFIQRHEWLGRISLTPTHFFTARYQGILAGVVIMDMPAARSKMLGEDTIKLERLISRGACVSWSPKNLASSLISFSMKWMVENTDYRLFTAYSDPEAKELGTIYQACNFYYLGQKFGAKKQFQIESGRWVSDRYFRSRSVYKRLAKKLGITWEKHWQGTSGTKDKIHFGLMPSEVAEMIKSASKKYQLSCPQRKLLPKHKYAFIGGRNKRERKLLRSLFESRNKIYPYPKVRGV